MCKKSATFISQEEPFFVFNIALVDVPLAFHKPARTIVVFFFQSVEQLWNRLLFYNRFLRIFLSYYFLNEICAI